MADQANQIADRSAVTTHVGILQDAIKRMADNSASCKTWCLTLVSALLSLAGSLHAKELATTALVPVVAFAFLDAMYLGQEKAFRSLYTRIVQKIRHGTYDSNDLFDMRAPLRLEDFGSAVCSWSVFPFYLGLVLVYVIAQQTGWLDLLARSHA